MQAKSDFFLGLEKNNRPREMFRAARYSASGALFGGLFSEWTGMTAVGWLGGMCGGMAFLPFAVAGGAVLGLAILGVRLSLRR